jgi:hypothetical protein
MSLVRIKHGAVFNLPEAIIKFYKKKITKANGFPPIWLGVYP